MITRRRTHRFAWGAALVASLLAPPAFAGWASLGAFPPPTRDGRTLLFRSEQGVAAVSVLAPEIVRVRFSPAPAFGRDHSYAVVQRDFGDPGAAFETAGDQSVITTSALRVVVTHSPFRVAFATASGESLDEDDPELGTAVAGPRVKVWKRLREDEHVYGLGEKVGRLDKRGQGLGGYAYTMWNSDTPAYDSGDRPHLRLGSVLHGAPPRARPRHLPRQHVPDDASTSATRRRSCSRSGCPAGELDYYFIDGPSPKQVIERYTALTGRMPLPPLWALGYHQCRYSYYPDARVRFIADNFRERKIPADAIWLDIHYLDNYKPFTWDRERFPDPKRLVTDLRAQGFRVVTILDPHPKKEPGSLPYDSGMAGGPLREEPGRLRLRRPGLALERDREPRPQRLPRLQQAGGPGMVGRALQAAHGRRSRRHLERHERAGRVHALRPHHARSRCATTTRGSRPTTGRSTTCTACS